MDFTEYKAIKAINASFLKACLNGLQAGYNYLNRPVKESPEMALGSAVHTYVLENEKFSSQYIVLPKIDRRTNEGKAAALDFEDRAKGKTILNDEQFELIQRIALNCNAHPIVSDMIRNFEKEKTYQFKSDGHDFKARLDLVSETKNVIVDLKTTGSLSTRDFLNDAIRMGYDVQFYTYSLALDEFRPDVMAIAVETKTAEVALYNLNSIVYSDFTQKRFKKALNIALEVLQLTECPVKYPQEIISLDLPKWINE
jgi:hypothetical protein